MNNPFGIPDEVLIAAVNAVIQQKGQQTKSHTPENPFKIDPAAMPLPRQSSFMMPMWK